MLNGRCLVPTLDFDEAGFLDGLFVITDANVGVFQNIIREGLMQLRRAVFHGLLHVQHKGKLFVFYLDGSHSLRGGDFILGNNGCHIISVKPHMIREQQSVFDILMRRVRGPGMSRRREIDFRNIKAGHHFDDTGNSFRL